MSLNQEDLCIKFRKNMVSVLINNVLNETEEIENRVENYIEINDRYIN